MKISLKQILIFILILVTINGAMYYLLENKITTELMESNQSEVVEKIYINKNENLKEAIKQASPAVVAITSTVKIESFFNNSLETENSGSGVIYDKNADGIYVITNHHVIDNSTKINIEFNDGEIKEAEIIGSDEEADLAVAFIKREEFSEEDFNNIVIAKFGDDSTLVPGDTAIAIGNGLGYGKTVTVGVVSALDRNLPDTSNYIYSLIQTDAAINPGNSGGALVNQAGEVIGINTIKIVNTQVEGVGFAIPINNVVEIAKELKEKGYLPKTYIGISGRTVEEQVSEMYNIPRGVYVVEVVEDGPAQKAGLIEKDVIIAVDDKSIISIQELIKEIRSKSPGDNIELEIIRDLNKQVITLEIGIME